jgi:hypothetical protein
MPSILAASPSSKLVAFRTPYDTGSFGKATAVFDNIGQTPAWHWFASALSGPVWGPWLLLLVVLVAWMGFGFAPRPATGFPAEGGAGVRRRHRDPKLVLMVSMLSAGWIWLVLGSQADAPDYYLQNLLLPLVLVVGLPTVVLLEASPSTKPMRLALLGTALLLPLKGVQLGALAASYATHLEWVGALAAERKTHPERPSKRFVQEAELPQSLLVATWSLPYECLLWSAVEGNPPLSVAVAPGTEQLEWARNYSWAFVTQWDSLSYGDMHEGYFQGFDGSAYVDWAP